MRVCVSQDGGSDVFVATRLFPTELTSKPESEKETTKIYEKDSLSRSLKIRWLAEIEIDVRSKVTCMHKSTCAGKERSARVHNTHMQASKRRFRVAGSVARVRGLHRRIQQVYSCGAELAYLRT